MKNKKILKTFIPFYGLYYYLRNMDSIVIESSYYDLKGYIYSSLLVNFAAGLILITLI